MSTAVPSTAHASDLEALLIEFDSSGQSAAAFARSKGLAPWKIYGALNRRRGKSSTRPRSRGQPTPELIPVRVVDAAAHGPSGRFELTLASGHRVLIPADFDALALRRLLEALARC